MRSDAGAAWGSCLFAARSAGGASRGGPTGPPLGGRGSAPRGAPEGRWRAPERRGRAVQREGRVRHQRVAPAVEALRGGAPEGRAAVRRGQGRRPQRRRGPEDGAQVLEVPGLAEVLAAPG